mmetsp:Transcript_115524/g.333742  ORF Transcript_115524/g.333742 Transcript_115524/m.333742 type:complete len:212 (+) Transcript_115524:2946-3581(+)
MIAIKNATVAVKSNHPKIPVAAVTGVPSQSPFASFKMMYRSSGGKGTPLMPLPIFPMVVLESAFPLSGAKLLIALNAMLAQVNAHMYAKTMPKARNKRKYNRMPGPPSSANALMGVRHIGRHSPSLVALLFFKCFFAFAKFGSSSSSSSLSLCTLVALALSGAPCSSSPLPFCAHALRTACLEASERLSEAASSVFPTSLDQHDTQGMHPL